ncbi:hypothetical protein T07_8519 [Trichinella nelsoni]|uniref:Peptidase aspartic putative domain-containing protein n=1 Tax=Trichinella nelsoni TaxID=6336 RepID=A0A0V0SI04_9BILA|nr:hypothetical protein T07_8519 [Trichinella nelsoni]
MNILLYTENAYANTLQEMVGLHPEERDACRFLWGDARGGKAPKEYRLTRVCFGLTCSPFLAIQTIRTHAERSQHAGNTTVRLIVSNIYVDDLVISCDSIEESKILFTKGGFNLIGFVSNCSGVVGYDETLPFGKDLKLAGRLWKTLGVLWDTKSDRLSFQQPEVDMEAQDTKRILLRLAATVFDPLGYLTPFTVRAKMLLLFLWQEGTSRDDTLSVPVAAVWRTWKGELMNLSQFRIDRACIQCSFMELAHMDLHGFADVSGCAYETVVYLRLVHGNGKVDVRFLAVKSRVAPIKKLSLPWLELMAALLCGGLVNYLRREADLPIRSCFCWSDSSVALCWIRSDAQRWKSFVSNQVRDIQEITSPDWWYHCPTQDNPADLLDDSAWPNLKVGNGKTPEKAELESRKTAFIMTTSVKFYLWSVMEIARYGSYAKLIRVTAWCSRFMSNARLPVELPRKAHGLTATDTREAEKIWIRQVQVSAYGPGSHRRKDLQQFNPCLDKDGILRVGGRLALAELPQETRYPMLLPHGECSGETVDSACAASLWNKPNTGRDKKKILDHQGTKRGQRCGKEMCVAPFVYVGVDFAGPILARSDGKPFTLIKTYVCVFTCMVVRAWPGTGSRHDVGQLFESDAAVYRSNRNWKVVGQDRLAKEGIEWKFINERAPCCGGYWECLVRSIKVALSKVLGRCHAKPDVLRHEALCLPKICQKPKLVPNVHRLKHLTPLQLADDFTGNSGAFGVLIGLDYYYEFVDHKIKRGKKGEPVAVHSTLGWIICGPMTNEKREPTSFSHSVKVLYAKVDEQLDEAIRKSWEIETIGMRDDSDKGDVDSSRPVQNFESTLQFDGIRYTIERSLKNDPRKAAHYERGMREYLEEDFVEEVTDRTGYPGRIWYLPHHAVIREDNIITKCRIVFDGSAQYGAMCVIRHHVKKYQHQFPEAVSEVLENMYVDDLLFSVDEEESASDMVAQLRKMMKLGGFPSQKRDEHSYPIPSNVDPNTLATKRQLISTTAKMYDPLRYLSPYLITAKILFQRLWQQGVDWDEKLPDSVHQEWKKWKTELMDIPEIRIRRCLIPFMRKEIRCVELHVFGDASKLAYGAAVYLIAIDKDGKRTVNLVLTKAKNRVAVIRQLTSPVLWRHCPTKNNPADLLSRGSTVKQLASQPLWWHGPPWLMEDKDCNFESKDYPSINLKIDEYYPPSVTVLVNVEEDIKLNPERFEDFEKLIRVTANCRLELQIAENSWIRKAQRECFANETQQLLNGKRITSNSQLIHLDPRIGSKPFVLKMAPLPTDRIQPTRPFENTGLDLAGPLLTRNGKTPEVANLESYNLIIFDPSSSWTRNYNYLEVHYRKSAMDGRILGSLIRSIKNSLHKVLQKALVDEEGLSAILCDIEARINARTLTNLSENPKDPEVLTPYHFLTGTNFMDLPEVNPEDEEWVPKAQLLQSYEKFGVIIND